jgi:mannosyltransferase OCH1-like enzyme
MTSELVANYMWRMRPNERKPLPRECIERNLTLMPKHYIIHPEEINSLAKETPVLKDLWDKIPHWIIKADLGRLLYIYNRGGFYLDVDCLLRKKLDTVHANKMVLFTEMIVGSVDALGPRECKNPENVLRVANYAFGTTVVKHPFLKEVIDECIARLTWLIHTNVPPLDSDILWVCGPDVITTVYHRSHKKYTDILLLDQSYLSHLCYGSWRGGS